MNARLTFPFDEEEEFPRVVGCSDDSLGGQPAGKTTRLVLILVFLLLLLGLLLGLFSLSLFPLLQ